MSPKNGRANRPNIEVVITDASLVSPLGHDLETFTRRMLAGDSGVVAIRGRWAPEPFPVPYGAVIDPASLDEAPALPGATGQPLKSWRMSAHVARRLKGDVKQVDALIFGTADGTAFDLAANTHLEGATKSFPAQQLRSESSLDAIQLALNEKGFEPIPQENLISINGACASGNQAIGMGFRAIQSGRWNRVLVGGVDARCEPSNFLNFHLLGALTTADVAPEKASRPFSLDRSGFVRGEGAALLMLESRASAEARGAKILGRVLGYGCTSDAFRLTDGRDDASSVAQAMRMAFASAGVTPEQIDYINAHGTSTPLNDRLETKAIKDVFGKQAYRVPISSLKSQIGHATVASSAIEAVACLMMLREQKIAPTLNLEVPDPECDLDFVPNRARDAKLKTILSNSFGFGGQNACAVFGS